MQACCAQHSPAQPLLLGWVLADTSATRSSKTLRAAITLACLAALIMPPAVLATGWFVTLSPVTDVSHYAVLLVIILNALMALPFVWSPLYPAIVESKQRHDRLCASLGLTGFARLKLIDLPVLRKPLALAFLMAVIVSLGDLSAISLFGSADFVTLPALIMNQMGHYRMDAAAGTALVLTAFCFALITLAQKWSGHDHP
jgi:thiamine transport system permease protein